LQVNVGARLPQPDRSLSSAQFDEAELYFEHFDHRFKITAIKTVSDVIEFHADCPLF